MGTLVQMGQKRHVSFKNGLFLVSKAEIRDKFEHFGPLWWGETPLWWGDPALVPRCGGEVGRHRCGGETLVGTKGPNADGTRCGGETLL